MCSRTIAPTVVTNEPAPTNPKLTTDLKRSAKNSYLELLADDPPPTNTKELQLPPPPPLDDPDDPPPVVDPKALSFFEKRYTLEIAYLDPDATPKSSPNAAVRNCCFDQFPGDTNADDPLATPKSNKPFLAASPLTASKSENNIFESNLTAPGYTVFDVVSLNDLNEATNFPNNSLMNDLSKMQVLNQLSDESVFAVEATAANRMTGAGRCDQ
jgi:hypothetical protein